MKRGDFFEKNFSNDDKSQSYANTTALMQFSISYFSLYSSCKKSFIFFVE